MSHYAADKLMLLYCSMTPMDNIKTVVSIYNVPIYRYYRYIILDTCVFN